MCNCGNKKCKVAALSAKTEGLKAAAEANPSGAHSWKPTRPEYNLRQHQGRLDEAKRECQTRQAMIALGQTCPLCARPVAPYGAEWSADTCQIGDTLHWRGHWTGEHDREQNRSECLRLAWARLTSPQPTSPPPQ
jgi:hypothetical protein